MRLRTGLLAAMGSIAIGATAGHLVAAPPDAQLPTMLVYKSPTCGCCTAWIEHVKQAGFRVVVRDTVDVQPVKDRWGLPPALASCHTARVGGYVIEGHVPADLIQKMLKDRPAIAGLAVPGMPMSAPGMDTGHEPYDVVSFEKQGKTAIYARR